MAEKKKNDWIKFDKDNFVILLLVGFFLYFLKVTNGLKSQILSLQQQNSFLADELKQTKNEFRQSQIDHLDRRSELSQQVQDMQKKLEKAQKQAQQQELPKKLAEPTPLQIEKIIEPLQKEIDMLRSDRKLANKKYATDGKKKARKSLRFQAAKKKPKTDYSDLE